MYVSNDLYELLPVNAVPYCTRWCRVAWRASRRRDVRLDKLPTLYSQVRARGPETAGPAGGPVDYKRLSLPRAGIQYGGGSCIRARAVPRASSPKKIRDDA